MTFLEYIRSKGETSYSLAKKAGISVRSIENYTNQKRPLRNSRAWFIVAVAEALGTTPKELLKATEQEEKE